MQEFHNPQNYDPAKAGEGFRFLTVEEAATLSDHGMRDNHAANALFDTLKPEAWAENGCRWVPAEPPAQKWLPMISEAHTYRTAAVMPEPVEPEEVTPEEMQSFALLFDLIGDSSHRDMRRQGFWESRDAIEAACLEHGGEPLRLAARAAVQGQGIALVHTELSEAVEALRDGNPPDDKLPEFSGLEAELADVVIRCMDLARGYGYRLGPAIVAKIIRNRARAKMHGRKF